LKFLDSRFHGNDRKERFRTFYWTIKIEAPCSPASGISASLQQALQGKRAPPRRGGTPSEARRMRSLFRFSTALIMKSKNSGIQQPASADAGASIHFNVLLSNEHLMKLQGLHFFTPATNNVYIDPFYWVTMEVWSIMEGISWISHGGVVRSFVPLDETIELGKEKHP
jgi:hypothetical protein